MDNNTILKVTSSFRIRFDNEKMSVLINLTQGQYYFVNEFVTLVLEGIKANLSVLDIQNKIASYYEISSEEIRENLLFTLNSLKKLKVIQEI